MSVITSADNFAHKVSTERFWLALSVAMIAVAAVISESGIGLALKVFLFVTGTVNGGLIFFEWLTAFTHKRNWEQARLSAFRLSQGLPLLSYERKNIAASQPEAAQTKEVSKSEQAAEVTRPVEVSTFTKLGPNALSVKIKRYADPPSRKFIEVLFQTAQAKDGRVRSEAAFAELGKEHGWAGSQSNVWLTYTDEQSITEKIYKSATGNSPRRLVSGVSLLLALKKFGLDENTSTENAGTDTNPSADDNDSAHRDAPLWNSLKDHP